MMVHRRQRPPVICHQTASPSYLSTAVFSSSACKRSKLPSTDASVACAAPPAVPEPTLAPKPALPPAAGRAALRPLKPKPPPPKDPAPDLALAAAAPPGGTAAGRPEPRPAGGLAALSRPAAPRPPPPKLPT